MISIFLALVASATDATYIKDNAAGNWSAILTHPGQASDSNHYHLRVVELPTKSFEASVFEDENSTSPLTTFSLSFVDGSTVHLKTESENEEEATQIAITLGMRYHLTSVGSYKQYVYNFNYVSSGRILITLYDNEKDEMSVIHLLKEIPPKTFFQKYGMMIFAAGAFGLSMFLNFKLKPNLAAQQQRQQQQRQQQQQKQAKSKVETVEENETKPEKVEEVKDENESTDQKKNTRDDEDENGKVKTE